MSNLVRPHGGVLVDRIVPESEAAALRAGAQRLPRIVLDARELADLELLAIGAASPLTGYLGSEDYESVLGRMRLANGVVWPLPLTLAVSSDRRAELAAGAEAALYDEAGRLWGVIQVSELFTRDPLHEARCIYRTDSDEHPGVAYLKSRPTWLVAGAVRVLPLPTDLPFARHRLTPAALRAVISARGWRHVAGFQTRNPIHRAHEHLTKLALEFTDGIVIHPLVGETKMDDVPAAVRFQAYELLIDRYYPKSRTLLAAFPAAMRYAGPREALFHALVRKNYGINRLIVGRDHAGVGKFYGPLEAQEIFEQFNPEELEVAPLKFDPTFYCQSCQGLASPRTCPHDPTHRLELSGSKVRAILREGGQLPAEFTRPEIAEILRAHYLADGAGGAGGKDGGPARGENGTRAYGERAAPVATSGALRPTPLPGFILWFTGLSGAGKSTLAQAVSAELAALAPARRIEILDGDDIRTYLSKGLGFSKEDRDTNIRRIGFVARLLARNGVVAVGAAISPYAEVRGEVRARAAQDSTEFVEVHVDADLDALIARDVKGLYKKAIAGEIDHFTGVSDPYERPANPDIYIRTDSEPVAASAARILAALKSRGLV
jgi:sulfate adenylyltransferase